MGTNPLLVIGRKPSAGNDAVDMGMEQEILPPRMETAKEADIGAQVFRIMRDFQERLRHGLEEKVVEFELVLEYKGLKFVRQREYDVEITGWQKLPLARRDPPLTSLILAFRTVSISARVVGNGLIATALWARIDMTTKSRCTTASDSAYRSQLLDTELMTIDEVAAPHAEDVGHLHGGPRHGCSFLLLDRFNEAMLETDMDSAGLATACK